MNPFSRFLSQWSRNPSFDEFVVRWDVLERTVVGVYRQKMTVAEGELEFNEVWPWLREQYGQWEAHLRPFWQQTKAGGQPTQTDPFLLLLAIKKTADIPGDWRIMQHLPAAREALNQYILAQSAADV